MLNLVKSRHSLPSKCHRTGLLSFHCSNRIGDASASYLNNAAPKETKVCELSNSVQHADSSDLTAALDENQPEKLSQSTTDTSTNQTSVAEKAKRKKTKNKKRSEKTEIVGGESVDDAVPTTELDSASNQLPIVLSEESDGAGKRSRKIKHDGQVVRSEDVDGYCGSLPVDDLIKFIDCSHKFWRSRSQTDAAASLTEVEKLQSAKKACARDAAVENDSGFGDVETPDRTDASHSDGALSPSISSVSESVEIVVELLSDSLNPSPSQPSSETREENLVDDVCEIPASAPPDWTVNNELLYSAAFLSDEELHQPEPEFVVVRQKKRRNKGQKVDAASTDKLQYSLAGLVPIQNGSMVCSSASSERSNSPPSVAAGNEFTINSRLGRRVSDTQGSISSFRRFNSEPKWRGRLPPRFNALLDTSSEVCPVRTRAHAYGNVSGRTHSGGKNVPAATSLQQREMEKLKNGKHNLSSEIARGSQLPDVVLNAERPRPADRTCVSSPATVLMQDAHCQTVDDVTSQPPDPDSGTDASRARVPFDLLTLQLFMYHAFEDVMNMSKSCIHYYSSLEATSSADAVH